MKKRNIPKPKTHQTMCLGLFSNIPIILSHRLSFVVYPVLSSVVCVVCVAMCVWDVYAVSVLVSSSPLLVAMCPRCHASGCECECE